jgi:predicted ester cyclase
VLEVNPMAEGSPELAELAHLLNLLPGQRRYEVVLAAGVPNPLPHPTPAGASFWPGATYRERVRYSRTGFPDLACTIHDLIATVHRVCVRWSAEGTHAGNLVGLPATGKRLRFAGLTIYDIVGEQVGGHWQVVDRLGFMQQLHAGRA